MTRRAAGESLRYFGYFRKPLFVLSFLSAAFLTACGTSTVSGVSNPGRTVTTETSSIETSAATSGSTTEVSDDTPAWRGTETELFAAEGDQLNAVGVRFDDRLNIRSGPGSEHDIVTSVAPTGTVVATGRAWQVPDGIWSEVDAGGETGWALTSLLSFRGAVDDATTKIKSSGGPYTAETIQDLALLVAESQASEGVESRITIVSEPVVGDLTEIKVDVLGVADDAVAGYRLQIFGQFSEGGEGIDLRTAERTTLCTRGVSNELCS